MSPSPFALLTHDLIFLPTPWAADIQAYRTLFRKLNSDAAFCHVAFGKDFEPFSLTDDEMRAFLLNRDVALRWDMRGMGDFALGVLPIDEASGKTVFHTTPGRLLENAPEEVRLLMDTELLSPSDSPLLDGVTWVGYTCVRDATTAGGAISDLYSGSSDGGGEKLPPWEEMIELRYGMDPEFRGRGIATRAAEVVMSWAVGERGARRFIAETQKENARSQALLRRLGFEASDTRYFEDDEAIEWVRSVS
ncbi:hypothetical protein PVAR5_0485 [Paecilomyces variotii No. 5]|uniref:N-acetyltransferase domain-containing protein n=1 Tax=Byssochlamys spectabilis (strain No. 5 / NBRC 109023) TaxID=1356009 RepID=V5FTH9_BYSSN|nr:hypothetical protein PVAR5_0485 [Paecilomyces variotii No. 5]